MNYQTYLASREWALKKEAVRKRSGGICERCKNAPHQQTHHLTYARIGCELLEDLQGVCRACHEYLSGKTNQDPADIKQRIAAIDLKIIELNSSKDLFDIVEVDNLRKQKMKLLNL